MSSQQLLLPDMYSFRERWTFPQLPKHRTCEAAIVFYHFHCAATVLYCWPQRSYNWIWVPCWREPCKRAENINHFQADRMFKLKCVSLGRIHFVASMAWVEYYRHTCCVFFLFELFSLHQQQDPILTHHNRVRTDSAGDIKEPMSGCGENNTLLSLFVPG